MKKLLSALMAFSMLMTLLATGATAYFNEEGYPIVPETIEIKAFNTITGTQWEDLHLFQAMEELTNIRVNFLNVPNSDADTKVNLQLASGDLPDVFLNSLSQNNLVTYGMEGGMLYDLSSLFPYMPFLGQMFIDFPDTLSAIMMTDGKAYCLPQYREYATGFGQRIYFRTDMLAEAGWDVPSTVQDFYDACVALKEVYGDMEGYYPVNLTTGMLYATMFSWFGDGWNRGFADNGDGVVRYNIISDQNQRMIAFCNKLFEEELLEPEMFTADEPTLTAKIMENKATFVWYGTNFQPENFGGSDEYMCDVLWPLLSEYTDVRKVTNAQNITIGAGAINAVTKYPEAIARWMDVFYAQEDVGNGIVGGVSAWIGVRGLDWDYAGDNNEYYMYLKPDDYKGSDEEYRQEFAAPAGLATKYLHFMEFPFGSAAGQLMKAQGCVDNIFPYVRPPFPDALFALTSEDNEIVGAIMADVNTYATQMQAKFITGIESMDQWDTFVSTIESMGIEQVLEIKQKYYDLYRGI